ncbi:MAG: excinuclease ABC subunit UvrA [Candidatus Omnitrophica bacterium]|nr:excinuclease ABC subunit UvrA [Candidatus Omnitrophota bacterium]
MKDFIFVKNAREHNLRGVDLKIPRNALVVFTGLSGSGKSSLAFDTIYAEGQRRYVESLSAYARQFLDQMQKPNVETIEGLSPAISIEQRVAGSNPRSTVGTATEIYDYLRLLFAKIGIPHCYRCGRRITRQTSQEIVEQILKEPEGTKLQILAPVVEGRKGEYREIFKNIQKEGFVRVRVDGQVREISDLVGTTRRVAPTLDKKKKHVIEIVVDRLVLKEGIKKRLADSVEAALKTGRGTVRVEFEREKKTEKVFSELHACVHCALSFQPPEPRLFSFNSPYGACPSCDGLGNCLEIDPELVVPDKNKPIRGGAIAPWNRGGRSLVIYLRRLLRHLAGDLGFSLDVPFKDLSKKHREIILHGSADESGWKSFEGVIPNLERRFKETESEFMKEEIHKYMSLKPCEECRGKRLKPQALSVKVEEKNIIEITAFSIEEAEGFFRRIRLTPSEEKIARPILKEISERLGFMKNVGLGYLSLDRPSGTLSGGEAQRIRLATQIGSGLMGVLYVLDEPSIGLHQRDNEKLLDALVALRNLGNTLIVVEHDEVTMKRADYLVDLGPGAGKHGGRIVAAGTPEEVMKNPESLTGQYLTGKRRIELPSERRPIARRKKMTVKKAAENNLKNIDVEIPLGVFTCVTGVSGSGKSTLVDEILFKGLARRLYKSKEKPGRHEAILGAEEIDKVIEIDQSPIGRTPRSNPATYTGVFGPIRDLFAKLPESRVRGFVPGRFSFNVKGGRCEACEGDGVKTIEMHFLPDVYVTCEVCKGKRFSDQTLEVRYKGKSISDVLSMSVEEALGVFENVPMIRSKLKTLHDVGLDYIELGQAATTLSGGEAQRVKLSTELSKRATGRTFYILDEPTTGLHFADIDKLLKVLQRLVDQGNTVLVIEHNLDVIKTADYLIDLGPEGGDKGGELVAAGPPEAVAKNPRSYTGRFLKAFFSFFLFFNLVAPFARAADDARVREARAYFHSNDFSNAAREFEALSRDAEGASVREAAAYWTAESYFKAKDYLSALKFYNDIIEHYPTSRFYVYSRYSKAWCLFELENVDDAILEFKRVIEDFPSHAFAVESKYKIAQALYELKKYDSAAQAFLKFIQENPLNPKIPNAAYLLGECQYNLGQYGAALESFKKSIELGGKTGFHAWALHGLAWSYFQIGKYPEALETFASFAEEPAAAGLADSFLFGRARALTRLGRHAEALDIYDQIIKDFPQSELLDNAFFWKAETLYDLGRAREAADLYEEMTRRFPAGDLTDDIQYNLAWAYLRLDKPDQAIEHFRTVVSEGHDETLKVSALCRIGDTALEKGDPEGALEQYDTVLKDFPGSIYSDYAQYQSGVTLSHLGRLDAAVLSFQSLLVNYPDSHFCDEALYRLGTTLIQKNNFAEAAAQFTKFAVLFPQSPLKDKAAFELGNCRFHLEEYEKALVIFKELNSRSPGSEVGQLAKYRMGWCYFRTHREKEGIAEFEDYLKRYPESAAAADVEFGLGQYYFDRGQYARSREYFGGIAAKFPTHAAAADALFRTALGYEREGDLWASVRELDLLSERFPKSEWSAKGMAKAADFLVSQGKTEEAKTELMKIINNFEAEPARSSAEKKLAEILKTEGRLREAAFHFGEALKRLEGEAACAARFELAEVYETEGDNPKAAAEFLKVSDACPKGAQAAEARLRAAKLKR